MPIISLCQGKCRIIQRSQFLPSDLRSLRLFTIQDDTRVFNQDFTQNSLEPKSVIYPKVFTPLNDFVFLFNQGLEPKSVKGLWASAVKL